MTGKLGRFLLIALAVAGLDQLTKAMIVAWLPAGGLELIPGYLDFVLVHNRGASFGVFSQMPGGRWLLVAVSVAALGLCLWLAVGPWGRGRLGFWALALICGGALGNLIDRLRLGQVVDFILAHWQQYHWPAFNVADSAITIGGVLLGWLLLRGKI
ncbi:lipoprotein signal peptidase [Desulfarculus baarsii DSM 2075]|uniref:Lipoprotein signal peptidase n=1 Tax=Desulfarculus baarsii (strain ATCC 33931 / DSM 2075 / LMG 7858 / VKM B-1802 / 2st14) TaxID=644282 RepID=E1QE01_DESB2|nr:signal peptidase II [Desulfarculus baarsii]ADK83787.1 lipoprotein signal peptidase [Desulfarculus baarsii DSM 2075]